jgi:hypothetical protein
MWFEGQKRRDFYWKALKAVLSLQNIGGIRATCHSWYWSSAECQPYGSKVQEWHIPNWDIYLFGALGMTEFNLMLHVTGTDVWRGYHREEGSATIRKKHLLAFLPLTYLPRPVLLSGVMFNDLRTLTTLRNLRHCPYTDWHHKVFATTHNKRTRHWWDDSWVIYNRICGRIYIWLILKITSYCVCRN